MTFIEWFKLIDTSGNGRITKKELKAYYETYVKDNKCGDTICGACGKGAVVPTETGHRCHCGGLTK